ncbi:MAG: Uma2 protein [Pseudomonadota bacterium]|nr:Uma2 protein [Pseudomonadota bacterium]
MSVSAERMLTELEYLDQERRAENRSEFYRGQIYAMAGASRAHNLITVNLTRELSQRLKGRPCEVYSSDMKVKVKSSGLYTYPDVTIVCGEPRFDDAQNDILLNPKIILEVLSPSTEAYDRGDKFEHYRRLASLSDYILVAQHRCRIEHFSRQADGRWLLVEVNDLQADLALDSISCALPLAEIYERVVFEDEG